MSSTWENISNCACKIKLQVDTGAERTVISSQIRTRLGNAQWDGRTRLLETYDGNQLTLLGSFTYDVLVWNGSRHTQNPLAVMQYVNEFGLLERDLLPKHGVANLTTERFTAVKGYKTQLMLIPG